MGTLLRSSLGLDCEEKDGRPWTVVLVFFQDGGWLMEFLKRGSLNSGSQPTKHSKLIAYFL
jgi:hypothetical protein